MPFILVPGAWLGGWAWNDVAAALRAAGQTAYPISLTGLADRSHLARPEVDLETHITDVVNLIETEELTDVTLVGHSYAGIVVTGVADRVPDRLARLVFVDSAPFEDGESFLGVTPPDAQTQTRAQVDAEGDGWLLPPLPFAQRPLDASLDGLSTDDLARLATKATPQPFATYTQPLRLTATHPPAYPRVIVACDDFRALVATGLPRFQIANQPGWTRHDLQTGHWPMLSTPADLTAALLTAP